jgi:hypothetical protein
MMFLWLFMGFLLGVGAAFFAVAISGKDGRR